MKKEVADLWIEALRSGKYRQGIGNLNYKNQFCCLGVLCEVAIANGLNVEVELPENTSMMKYDGAKTILPSTVQQWAGMRTDGGRRDLENKIPSLWELNDNLGYTFNAIANVIESEWETL